MEPNKNKIISTTHFHQQILEIWENTVLPNPLMLTSTSQQRSYAHNSTEYYSQQSLTGDWASAVH